MFNTKNGELTAVLALKQVVNPGNPDAVRNTSKPVPTADTAPKTGFRINLVRGKTGEILRVD
jgi:hypothetical protein